MKTFNAIRIAGQTLVGSFGEFPRKGGNCFSIENEDDKEYRILNFKIENLEELIRRGELSWPIKCESLSEYSAVVNDGRIPDDWYMDHFCEVCTPLDLLPLPQRLKHLRDIQRGDRTEYPNGLVSIKIKPVPSRSLKAKWKIEPMIDLPTEMGDDVERELEWTDEELEDLDAINNLQRRSSDLEEELSEAITKVVSDSVTKTFYPNKTRWTPKFETETGEFVAPEPVGYKGFCPGVTEWKEGMPEDIKQYCKGYYDPINNPYDEAYFYAPYIPLFKKD